MSDNSILDLQGAVSARQKLTAQEQENLNVKKVCTFALDLSSRPLLFDDMAIRL